MNKKSRFSLTAALVACVFSFATDMKNASAAEKIVTVGTAGVTGVYYPAGGAICRLMNRGRKDHGVRCVVESTGGSINNLEMIRKGDLDMGVVQSDLLYHAYMGDEIFSDVGADKNLRVLFSLHAEPFTVVARKDAKINSFDDLKGKRVSLGAVGSGMRATMEELMAKKGWSKKTFAAVVDVKNNDIEAALCGNKVDAIVYAGGHPNGTIQQLTGGCDTKLVSVTGSVIDDLVKNNPYYSYATIPGGMYNSNPKETKTFGVRAVLVASSEMDDAVAYELVKGVFDRLDDFKTLHPVFATLDKKQMVNDTGVAPLHPGAARYFKERGLLE